MAAFPSTVIDVVIPILVMLCLATSSHATTTTYATNLTASTVESTSVTLTWLAPDDPSAANSYFLTILDEAMAVILNVTIVDIASTSYDVSALTYSTWHNATLETLDSAGSTIGLADEYFLTEYDPLNFNAVCAMGVVGALIFILVAVKVAAKVCNPDKAAEKWKQELLVSKQNEREERKKKLSEGAMKGSTTGLDLV